MFDKPMCSVGVIYKKIKLKLKLKKKKKKKKKNNKKPQQKTSLLISNIYFKSS